MATGPAAVDLVKFSDRLSNREFQVVCEAMKGKRNKEIVSTLFQSDYTVDNHLRRIYRKFGVHNRTELTALATNMN